MRLIQHATRSARIFAAALVLAATAAGLAPATAALAAQPGPATAATRTAPAAPAISGGLSGVAAVSARDAWAVGSASSGRSLVLHWNGTGWSQVPSPPGSLSGVAAVSASDAWAVGCSNCSGTGTSRPLILHWNGSAWAQVPSPTVRGGGRLSGVAAVSARNAWAVGSTNSARTLIERWNGTTWQRVPSPNLGASDNRSFLGGVTTVSAHLAWAVGGTFGASTGDTRSLILHWNGTVWRRVPSPSPGVRTGSDLSVGLNGVSASSARQAWAVGNLTCGCGPGPAVILRWNGTAWKKVHSPTGRSETRIGGVAASSGRSAWIVGDIGGGDGSGPTKTLILRWNGTAWKRVASPTPRGSAGLSGVTTTAGGAWAVGGSSTRSRTSPQSLILRWNGTTWK
jgi:hypothetical protein